MSKVIPDGSFYKHWEKTPEQIKEMSEKHNIPVLHRHFDDAEFLIFNTKVLPELGRDNGFYLSYENIPNAGWQHNIQIMGFVGSGAQFPCSVVIYGERKP